MPKHTDEEIAEEILITLRNIHTWDEKVVAIAAILKRHREGT